VRTLFLYTFLLILAASLMSCQKNDDKVSFESIYSNNDINKIVIRDKNLKIKEITDTETINKWMEKVGSVKFIRDENQEERDFNLLYDGCLAKAFDQDEEVGDFKRLKLKGVYYKENAEFDKLVELLCKLED
jgi:hypothetical protein